MQNRAIVIVILVTAAVIALGVFIAKKMKQVEESGKKAGEEAEVVEEIKVTPIPESLKSVEAQSQMEALKVAYEKLPRNSDGSVKLDTPEVETYCQQEQSRLVVFKVKWACYTGDPAKYYTYHEQYVEAPKNQEEAAKAVAKCPSGVEPSNVRVTFVPQP